MPATRYISGGCTSEINRRAEMVAEELAVIFSRVGLPQYSLLTFCDFLLSGKYRKNARERSFKEGDQELVPTSAAKLEAQWQGLYVQDIEGGGES